MSKTTKLELTWIGKENRPRLEPRILLEDAAKSYHAKKRLSAQDVFDNRLICGDNLLALKALEQEFSGKFKCIFIDPPYNTGAAFTHYDDGVEHSLWLSMMRDRLELLRRLLSDDGSLWITIDDTEAHYLKVLCDEVFGRANFVANVIWQKRFSPNSTAQFISDSHDHVLLYAKAKDMWKRKLLPRLEKSNANYKNPDNDPRGLWTSSDLSARNFYSLGTYAVQSPKGRIIDGPPPGRYWTISPDKFKALESDNRIWWGADGNNTPRLKRFLSEVREGIVPQTVWLHEEVGNTQEAKKEVMAAVPPKTEVFQTPKPERLLYRILELSSSPGDWILDSFAGSGTTGAVAHKMGRKWIMIELGEHCHTHIIPRLQKVIDGKDQGGISGSVQWNGGGGFRCYRLAPSLLSKDKFGNWVISKQYNSAMLAEAMCKFEGFTYAPSDSEYWIHGHSTERDFVYVTTQTLTREQLQKLSDDVGGNRSLLVCCSAFRVKDVSQFPNLTIKKIPKMVLNRCEWDRDDYSLEVKNLPEAPAVAAEPDPVAPSNGRRKTSNGSMNLFEAEAEENHSR